MKRLGSLLILGGAAVGVAVVAGMEGVFHLALPWIVNVGLAKLTLAASLGLMGGGAFVRRLAIRREHRGALGPGRDNTPTS